MQEQEALELARSFARNEGRDPDRYHTKAVLEGKQWTVEFLSRQEKPRPGDFFTVHIDDQSQRVERLVPGK